MSKEIIDNWIIRRCKKWLKLFLETSKSDLSADQLAAASTIFSMLIPEFEEFEILDVSPDPNSRITVLEKITHQFEALTTQIDQLIQKSVLDLNYANQIREYLNPQAQVLLDYKKAHLISDFAYQAHAMIKDQIAQVQPKHSIPYTQIKKMLTELASQYISDQSFLSKNIDYMIQILSSPDDGSPIKTSSVQILCLDIGKDSERPDHFDPELEKAVNQFSIQIMGMTETGELLPEFKKDRIQEFQNQISQILSQKSMSKSTSNTIQTIYLEKAQQILGSCLAIRQQLSYLITEITTHDDLDLQFCLGQAEQVIKLYQALYTRHKDTLEVQSQLLKQDSQILPFKVEIQRLCDVLEPINQLYLMLIFVLSHFEHLGTGIKDQLSKEQVLSWWTSQDIQTGLPKFLSSATEISKSDQPLAIQVLKTVIYEPKLWKVPNNASSSQSFIQAIKSNWEAIISTTQSKPYQTPKAPDINQFLIDPKHIPAAATISVLNLSIPKNPPQGYLVDKIPKIPKTTQISQISPDIQLTDTLLNDLYPDLLSF